MQAPDVLHLGLFWGVDAHGGGMGRLASLCEERLAKVLVDTEVGWIFLQLFFTFRFHS